MNPDFSQVNPNNAPVNPAPQNLPETPIDFDGNNKKHSVVFYIVLALIGIIAVAAIIFFTNIIINSNKKPEEPEPQPQATPKEEPETKKAMTAAEKEAAVKNTLASLKAAAENSVDDLNLNFQDVYDTYFPYYLPKNAKTGLQLDRAFSIYFNSESLGDLNIIETVAEAVRDELDKLGFVEYNDVKLIGGPQYLNEENGLICGTVSAGLPFIITCGHTSWVTTEKIAFVNSLAEAYFEKMQEYPVALNASKSEIVDSVFTPYQRITASMPSAGAIFYRPSETAAWVFFTSGQAAPSCQDFKKDDGARRAFHGEICYNSITKEEETIVGS